MKDNLMIMQSHRQAGFVLLLTALALILGVFLTYKIWRGFGVKLDTGQKWKNPPWRQWEVLQRHLDRKDLGEPSSQQPQIAKTIGLKTTLFEDQDEKGAIWLGFRTDYTIEGGWRGSFYIDPNRSREYELVACNIKGYLVPDETYVDLDVRDDPGKIYFLSKGLFTAVEYNNINDRVRKVTGDIYVSGWLSGDYTIHQGQVIITSDKKNFKTYTFSGKAELMADGFLFL